MNNSHGEEAYGEAYSLLRGELKVAQPWKRQNADKSINQSKLRKVNEAIDQQVSKKTEQASRS